MNFKRYQQIVSKGDAYRAVAGDFMVAMAKKLGINGIAVNKLIWEDGVLEKKKNNLIFGCIADDFTGASDVASFLVKGGMKTLLFNGIPSEELIIDFDCSAIVIALKTRTQNTKEAVEDSKKASKWLLDKGVDQLFIKYCSTFDSTKEGNIGPIVDSIIEELNTKYTILCPALPINKRTVKDGHLYVDGIPLNESSMKDHPLTPMWESDISKLMEPQGKYSCLKVNYDMLKKSKEEILNYVNEFGKDKDHFYVIPDFIGDEDAKKIVEVFGDLKVLTGGSGLMTQLGDKYSSSLETKAQKVSSRTKGNGLLLAGSCSKATLQQISEFKKIGGKSFRMNPLELFNGEQTIEEIWRFIEENQHEEILIYSSDEADKVREIQKIGREKVASLLENITAKIAKRAVDNGYKRIIVAGGETSGAVTKELNFDSYLIGESIAPGVPIMVPLNNKEIRLVLKSGNFGQNDFFIKALEMTRE